MHMYIFQDIYILTYHHVIIKSKYDYLCIIKVIHDIFLLGCSSVVTIIIIFFIFSRRNKVQVLS